MLQLVPATKAQMPFVRRVYRSSFPLAERKPMAVIRKGVDSGLMELLVAQKDGQNVGIVITACVEGVTLLDYFAMAPDVRGGGLGSQFLRQLLMRQEGRPFFLEIESTEVPCSNQEQRLARKAFYLRNGMADTGHRICLFGVEMELLANSQDLPYSACEQLYRRLYGTRFEKRVRFLETVPLEHRK